MKKRIISLLLCAAMTVSMLAGCGSKTEAPAENAGAETPADAVTLKVAAIETAYGADMWKEVTAAFTEATGIAVELTTNK